MKRISRPILIGALVLTFMLSACDRLLLASPTPVWTVTPSGQPAFSTATLLSPAAPTGTPVTPGIPITGENAVYLQCEFCVDTVTHAVLILPEAVSFDVSSDTSVSCLTADVTGGRRILLCRGAPSTTFTLNVCSDPSNCQQFQGTLQPCPLLQASPTPITTGTSFNGTPVITFTPSPPKKTKQPDHTVVPSSTPSPGGVPATSTPATPLPTSYSAGFFVNTGQ